MENSSVILLVVAIAGGLFLLWIILYLIPVGLWFQALVSDVKISLLQLVLMRWRKVPPTVIVSAMIEGKKAGIELYRDLLEGFVIYGALIGGFIGIVLGLLGAYGICSLPVLGFKPAISIVTIVLATVFSSAVGIFFGIYPAKKAARLSPIEALRRN